MYWQGKWFHVQENQLPDNIVMWITTSAVFQLLDCSIFTISFSFYSSYMRGTYPQSRYVNTYPQLWKSIIEYQSKYNGANPAKMSVRTVANIVPTLGLMHFDVQLNMCWPIVIQILIQLPGNYFIFIVSSQIQLLKYF